MNNTPLISVLVPCCNVEKYLRQCLDSIINQTYTELEIICLNDGSTDSTPDTARKIIEGKKCLPTTRRVITAAMQAYTMHTVTRNPNGDSINDGLTSELYHTTSISRMNCAKAENNSTQNSAAVSPVILFTHSTLGTYSAPARVMPRARPFHTLARGCVW